MVDFFLPYLNVDDQHQFDFFYIYLFILDIRLYILLYLSVFLLLPQTSWKFGIIESIGKLDREPPYLESDRQSYNDMMDFPSSFPT